MSKIYKSISDGLRVRIKFMGQYGRPPLATAGLLVEIEALLKVAYTANVVLSRNWCETVTSFQHATNKICCYPVATIPMTLSVIECLFNWDLCTTWWQRAASHVGSCQLKELTLKLNIYLLKVYLVLDYRWRSVYGAFVGSRCSLMSQELSRPTVKAFCWQCSKTVNLVLGLSFAVCVSLCEYDVCIRKVDNTNIDIHTHTHSHMQAHTHRYYIITVIQIMH